MRPALSVLFVGALLANPSVVFADAVFERELQSQTAAIRIGAQVIWPDDSRVAEPEAALRILAEAAEATESNVVRTTVNTSESGRKRITHYIFMGRNQTGLFDEFTLAEGRWLSPTESRTGSATVSSTRTGDRDNVGVPAVIGGRYELTFAPLRQAFDSLPSTGRYVVESLDGTATDRFLAIVHQRLVEAGVTDLAMEDLTADGIQVPVDSSNLLSILAYILAGAATLIIAFILLREGKMIGVLRLMGYSSMRIWYRAVGKLQLAALFVGLGACTTASLVVPGVDALFLHTLAAEFIEVAVIGFAATMSVGLAIIIRVQVTNIIKGSLQ